MEANKRYDLSERTARFGVNIIRFAKRIPVNQVTRRLIPQLVAAGTAIGANYAEADCAESGKDFVHKLSIANKEAKETKFFLEMIATADEKLASDARILWKEANELNKIMSTIIYKIRSKHKK